MTLPRSFSALLLAALPATLSGQELPRQIVDGIPITGRAGPGLEAIDFAVLRMMDRHGVPGAALAIAKNGRLVLAKGYGWASAENPSVPAAPTNLFGLASLSKTLTATAVLRLVEQGKLRLEDRAFDILNSLQSLPAASIDPRLRTITVRQLLNHSGGWNRSVSGDPVMRSKQIAFRLGVRPPLTADQLISYVVRTPLDFDPGTDAHYSNLGYILLGQIIAKVGGTPYDQYVRANVLMPAGARGAALHRMDGKYLPGEALRYLAGTDFFLPPLQLPMADAAGGWSASVLDMIRFLTALDGSRGKRLLSAKAWQQMLDPPPPPLQPRANGTYFGLGWDSVIRADSGPGYFKDGSFYGMRSFMKHTPAGVSWVLLFNASMQPDAIDTDLITQAVREVREVVETAKHPDIDLFGTFP